jgi:hypothetical protein
MSTPDVEKRVKRLNHSVDDTEVVDRVEVARLPKSTTQRINSLARRGRLLQLAGSKRGFCFLRVLKKVFNGFAGHLTHDLFLHTESDKTLLM